MKTVNEIQSFGSTGTVRKYIQREAKKRYKILQESQAKRPLSDRNEGQNSCALCHMADADERPKGDMFVAPKIAETN